MWNWYVNKNLKYLYTEPYFMNSGNILKEKNAGIFVKIAEIQGILHNMVYGG